MSRRAWNIGRPVDKSTSNQILLQKGRGIGSSGSEDVSPWARWRTTISCFSLRIRRAAIAPTSAWQTLAFFMNTSYLLFYTFKHIKPMSLKNTQPPFVLTYFFPFIFWGFCSESLRFSSFSQVVFIIIFPLFAYVNWYSYTFPLQQVEIINKYLYICNYLNK